MFEDESDQIWKVRNEAPMTKLGSNLAVRKWEKGQWQRGTEGRIQGRAQGGLLEEGTFARGPC